MKYILVVVTMLTAVSALAISFNEVGENRVASRKMKAIDIKAKNTNSDDIVFLIQVESVNSKSISAFTINTRMSSLIITQQIGDTVVLIGRGPYGYETTRVDLTNGKVVQTVSSTYPQPVISPDNRYIAFVRGIPRSPNLLGSSVVMILDAEGGNSVPVFPEENAIKGEDIVLEEDSELLHNNVSSEFLWSQDGKRLYFVAKRGLQWWDNDLCMVDLSEGPANSRIARRRLDFGLIARKKPVDQSKCGVWIHSAAWTETGKVRVAFTGCPAIPFTSMEFETPSARDVSKFIEETTHVNEDIMLENIRSGYRLVKRIPWPWVRGIGDNGLVKTAAGERLAIFSEMEQASANLYYVRNESNEKALQVASLLIDGNKKIDWQKITDGDPDACPADSCWRSSDRLLHRLLFVKGRYCVLINAEGQHDLPDEVPAVESEKEISLTLRVARGFVKAIDVEKTPVR